MSNKTKSFLAFLTLIALAVYYFESKKNQIEFIKDDYSFTRGEIIRAYLSDGASIWMDYTYEVKGEKFKTSFTPKSSKYRRCYEDFLLCDTLEFWVAFSNTDPGKSMIDLTYPVSEGENPKVSRNIDNFELD